MAQNVYKAEASDANLACIRAFEFVRLVEIKFFCHLPFFMLVVEEVWYTGLFLICLRTPEQSLNLLELLAVETIVQSTLKHFVILCVHRLYSPTRLTSEAPVKELI